MLRFVGWIYLTIPVVLREKHSGKFRAVRAGRETALSAACFNSHARQTRFGVKPECLLANSTRNSIVGLVTCVLAVPFEQAAHIDSQNQEQHTYAMRVVRKSRVSLISSNAKWSLGMHQEILVTWLVKCLFCFKLVWWLAKTQSLSHIKDGPGWYTWHGSATCMPM